MHGSYARAADRGRGTRRLLAGLAAGCLLACVSGSAQARVELVRWRQPHALPVLGFNLHVGTESGSYSEAIDVGAPTASDDGVYAFLLSVPDASKVYVAVTAYNDAGASGYSNEAFLRAGGEGENLRPDVEGENLRASVEGQEGRGRDRHQPGGGQLDAPARGRLALAWPEPVELHASLDPRSLPETAGVEVRGRLRVDEQDGGIGVTLRDPVDGDAFYWLARDPEPGAPFTVASTTSTLACADALPVPEAGAWYQFRLFVQPYDKGTFVGAKVWPSGRREPRAWTRCADKSSSRLVAAVPGVWAAGAGLKSWDRIKVKRPPE